MKKFLFPLFILCLVLLQGCGIKDRYEIAVDSLTSADFETESQNAVYAFLPVRKADLNDLYYAETERELKSLFQKNGCRTADSPQNADILVQVDSGLSDLKTVRTVESAPVMGTIGFAPSPFFDGPPHPYEPLPGHVRPFHYGPRPFVPVHGVVGLHERETRRTVHVWRLNLKCLRLNKKKTLGLSKMSDVFYGDGLELGNVVWQIATEGEGTENGYRAALPYLSKVLECFFAKNSMGRKLVLITEGKRGAEDAELEFERE